MDSTQRFSSRVDDYIKYRPTYPDEVLGLLKDRYGLKTSSFVVDVGSGTGISAELFLKMGCRVYGIEPNEKMRQAAETQLKKYPSFQSINGTAEKTTLPDKMADFIVAAQAFHWFDPKPTKLEFKRLLRPQGKVVIIFNDRKIKGSEFLVRYEDLLNEFGTDYKNVKHQNVSEEKLLDFLGPYHEFHYSNQQDFDFDGLLGRLKSSSYVPRTEDSRFPAMCEKLKQIFDQCQENGKVSMVYTTQVFCSSFQV